MQGARDVCIVGGGPAGLAAAIVAAQRGLSVEVVDAAVPPIDKACGEGLMPDGIAALRSLGIELPLSIGAAFLGIRFLDSGCSVAANFLNGPGIALRRTALHDLLRQRAEALGAVMHWGAKHANLVEGGVSVAGRLIKAHYVIGADGQNSRIRRQAGLDQIQHERRRFGFRRHYRARPWSSYMDLYWGPDCQIYASSVARDELCIAIIGNRPDVRLHTALHHFPALRERIAAATPVGAERGGLSVSRALAHVTRGRIALIGDASGSVDAITGEGICICFKQAIALGEALMRGDLGGYERAHRGCCAATG